MVQIIGFNKAWLITFLLTAVLTVSCTTNSIPYDVQLNQEAVFLMDAGEFELAIQKFNEAIALNPQQPENYRGLGVTYMMQEN